MLLYSLTGEVRCIEYGAPKGIRMASDGRRDRSMMNLMTVGIVLVACVGLGYFLGSTLDKKLGTSPWCTIAGVLLGSAAGFLQLFRTVSRDLK